MRLIDCLHITPLHSYQLHCKLLQIVDTDGGVATTYDGNYSRFLKLKKARLEAMEAAYATQQKKLADERAWINKFKNKGSFGSQVCVCVITAIVVQSCNVLLCVEVCYMVRSNSVNRVYSSWLRMW
jgi:ABC transporter